MAHAPLLSTILCAALAAAFPARAFGASSNTSDINSVPLISTGTYDPTSEQGRGFTQFFTGIGIAFAGPSQDLAKTIKDKLDNPALRTYFPDANERARMAQLFANDVKQRYLSNGFSNQSVDAALKYLTDRLVGTIVVRVLLKEGVKDPDRAGAWADKIKVPFDQCMAKVVNYKEAQKCSGPLEADLVKNVGQAMAYELTKQEFGVAAKPALYQSCLRPTQPGADDRVRPCALESVRASAADFGRARLLEQAKKVMPLQQANAVVNTLLPSFQSCLKGAQDRVGFNACADRLVQAAGPAIVSATIANDPRVKTYFPSAADRDRLAAQGADAFAKCMEENSRGNLRDSTGAVRTDTCQSFVTLETSKSVAIEIFRQTIAKNLGSPATDSDRASLLQKSSKALNACWDSRRAEADASACLRGVVKQLATDVASAKMDGVLPKDTKPEVKKQLLADFGTCLEQKLPKDPIQQDGADTAAAACAGVITKSAAITIAEQKIRAALQGKVTDAAAVDSIVADMKDAFAGCLGDSPADATLASCELKLEKNVAFQASQLLVPGRLDQFFKDGGGLASYGLDTTGRQKILDAAIGGQKQCLKTQVNSLDADVAGTQIDGCFKTLIHDLSLQLGALEFQKQAKANGVDVTTANYKQVSQDFLDGFGRCLDKKKDKQFSLDDYLTNLSACQDAVTKSTTSQVAKNELASTIKAVLGDAGADLQERLLKEFDDCLAKAANTAATSACVAQLKAHATVELAKSGVHGHVSKDLGLTELPDSIKALDTQLDSCAAKGSDGATSDCAVQYVRDASKEIAHLQVNATLAPLYGDAKVQKLQPSIQKELLAPFNACVESVKPPLDQKMLDAITACGNDLTTEVLTFMMVHAADSGDAPAEPKANDPPANPPAPAAPDAKTLTDMLGRTVMCMNGSLEPGSEQAIQNLEPGSSEAKLLQLIGAYVNYDLDRANGDYAKVLDQLSTDLNAAGGGDAKQKLVTNLVNQGMADQLLKALVKSDLEKTLAALPADKKFDPALAAKLTDKATLDAALTSDVLAKLRPAMASGVLTPVLVDGKDIASSGVLRAFRDVRGQAVDALLASPALGLDDAGRASVKARLGR